MKPVKTEARIKALPPLHPYVLITWYCRKETNFYSIL